MKLQYVLGGLFFFLLTGLCQAQTTADSFRYKDNDTVVDMAHVVQKASFPGGESALYYYIAKNVKYPLAAMENDIQGTVYVQFVVNKDGSISNIETYGKKLGYGLEEAAIEVIKKMPKWEPAIQKDKPVAMLFKLPIKFQLANDSKKKKTSAPVEEKRKKNYKAYD